MFTLEKLSIQQLILFEKFHITIGLSEKLNVTIEKAADGILNIRHNLKCSWDTVRNKTLRWRYGVSGRTDTDTTLDISLTTTCLPI